MLRDDFDDDSVSVDEEYLSVPKRRLFKKQNSNLSKTHSLKDLA